MKKILIFLFLIIPIFSFSQIVTLISKSYTVDRGGTHSENFYRHTKIKIYEDKIKFVYQDQLIPVTIKLKNVKVYVVDGNFSITAQVKCRGDARYVVLYLTSDSFNMLDVEHKNYIQSYKISKIDKSY